MTPMKKQSNKNDAEVRMMTVMELRAKEEGEEEGNKYIVEGYAAKYEPYVLYEEEDGPIYEQFSKANFEGADKSDIILQYDHAGKVFARTSNGTLEVEVDSVGLKIKADLSKTESARQLWEEINTGMVTKMSWRFTVSPDAYKYDKKKRLLTYSSIKKIWDVSAVSIPANPDTEISSARSYVNGEIVAEKARSEAEQRMNARKAELLARLEG